MISGLLLFWTNCQKYGLGIRDVIRLMAEKPAQLCHFNNRKGYIEVGYRADFCIWDPEGETTIETDMIEFRNKANPYMGQTLKGCVHATVVGGQFAYKRDENKFTRVGRIM